MGEKERFMEATRGARIRRRGQELGMTQLDLAERTELSEATVRSYELGTSNPQDAHHEAIAEAMGVSADYLREYDGYRESEIVHFLMETEDAGFLRPVLIDGTAYVIPVQANLEDGIQEWTEKERVGHAGRLRPARRRDAGMGACAGLLHVPPVLSGRRRT